MRYPRFFFKKLVNDKNNFCGFLAILRHGLLMVWILFSQNLLHIKGYNDANERNG